MSHVHRAIPSMSRIKAFTGPVRSPENRKAHGGICQVDACTCGSRRLSNRNAGAIEMGKWQTG